MALLSLKNVSLSYGGKPLLDDVEFHIERGDRICLLGVNGTGKSSMLRILAGEAKPELIGEIRRQHEGVAEGVADFGRVDIAARWGLDDDLIAAMAARDILYDRIDDGQGQVAEYFQFYTRAFARRVFFELVERRGYSGYGAVNAPIRLAAQARHKTDAYS